MRIEEIEHYYRKYGPMVLRRCRFLLKTEDRALDAMQEVFMKLLSNRKNLVSQYPSTLLYKMATNVCLNMIKAENNRRLDNDSDILAKIACAGSFEDKLMVNELLDKIFMREPVSTKEIAVMHYVDGLTLEETAELSGLSVSGVRKRLRRLREKNLVLREF